MLSKNNSPSFFLVVKNNIIAFLRNSFLFYSALILIIAGATYLNYNSTTQGGILHYYEEFSKLIRAGIYQSEFYKTAGTFPMWGYGFVFAITHSKILIILSQQVLNFLIIYSLDNYLKEKLYSSRAFIYFRAILLLSFPLYFFHSVLWPYSFSSSFLILGIILLVRYLENTSGTKAKVELILSAICIGISLNFRSDYLLCIIFIYFILLGLAIYKRSHVIPQVLYLSLWSIIILVSLVPWTFYTKKVNNHYLLNSTNAGHVLYIGLGQLPGNKWHIEPYDDDSSMRNVIETNLHSAVFSTTTYQADSLLKKVWMNKVTNDPVEYLKKCVYNYFSIFIQPFAQGDGFRNSFSDDELITIRENMRRMKLADLFFLFRDKLSPILFVSLFTALFAIIFHFAFWIYLIKTIRAAPKMITENKFILLSLIVIFYQIALLTAGYYHRNYNTNIYLLYTVVLFLLVDRSIVSKNARIVHESPLKQ